jgi:hypothetical protein
MPRLNHEIDWTVGAVSIATCLRLKYNTEAEPNIQKTCVSECRSSRKPKTAQGEKDRGDEVEVKKKHRNGYGYILFTIELQPK